MASLGFGNRRRGVRGRNRERVRRQTHRDTEGNEKKKKWWGGVWRVCNT